MSNVREIPERERLPSEVFRIAAKEWVELDGAARILESTKDAVLSQMVIARGKMAVARAEREAKASPEWTDFLEKMNAARTRANLARVKMKWTEMKFSEWQSMDANGRTERRMSR